MSLNIGDALSDGIDRTLQRNGLLLVGVFIVFNLANAVVTQSSSAATADILSGRFGGPGGPPDTGMPFEEPFVGMGGQDVPLSVPLPLPLLGLLTLLAPFVAEWIHIVSIRVFADEGTETIPPDLAKRNALYAVINGVIGGFIVLVLTVIGLIFLIIPGLFIAVSFYFVRQIIALEDDNFIDAMSRSWMISQGNRFELFGLLVILVVINFVAGIPTFFTTILSPALGTVLTTIIGGFVTVFSIAAVTRAYMQLRDSELPHLDEESGVEDLGEESEFDFG